MAKKIKTQQHKDFSLYLEFRGSSVNKGEIDMEIAGKSMLAFSRILKKYQKEVDVTGLDFSIKLKNIYPGSTGLEFVPDAVNALANLASTGAGTLFAGAYVGGKAAHILQIQEFFKGFMGTLGKQYALRVMSKGSNLVEKETKIKKDKEIAVMVSDEKGGKYELSDKEWRAYQALAPVLGDLLNLRANEVEKVSFGYKERGYKKKTGEIEYKDAKYFEPSYDSIEERQKEPFDDSRAENVTLEGRFVDYHGLAHKYFFSFQVRRDTEKYGKQKVLCIVPTEQVSKILDLLKPENERNVVVVGKATRDRENRLDKMMVESWADDTGHGSDQEKLDFA